MAEDWTQQEVSFIVQDYFNMLQQELQQQSFNKKQHREALLPLLNGRSNGSIEFKHANISAVLANMGLPYINGYKPRGNFQNLLEEVVADYVNKHRSALVPLFENFADAGIIIPAKQPDFSTMVKDAPKPSKAEEMQEEEPAYRPIKTNYLEKEQNNRLLGEQGEQLVIEYERWRLIHAGKEKLAETIQWVSKTQGDGLGYDILSKNENGTDRYVEVKTTKLSKETPIYLTKREVLFAATHAASFHLYRVFNFATHPEIFIKDGPYGTYCHLLPTTYKGYF